MAGDWIKMRHDLRDDPAVIQIAESLHIGQDLVVGLLHRFWTWGDKHTTNGCAPSVTVAWLDSYMGCNGFADAMQKVSWLFKKNGGFRIPKFNAHNSKSAKKRALAARRMQDMRDASSATPASPEKRREEKRRKKNPLPPLGKGRKKKSSPRKGISEGLDLGPEVTDV